FEQAIQQTMSTQVAQTNGGPPPEDQAISMPDDLETPFDPNDPLAPPVLLDLPIDAQIPQTYIEEESLRLQMYRRIAGITHPESIDEMRKEMVDRFGADDETGAVPIEVENLFYQIRVRILALR